MGRCLGKRVINEWQETQNGCPVTANGAGLTHRKHRHEMGGDAMSRALIWSSEEQRGSRRSAEGMKELQRWQRGSKRNLHSRLTIATVRTDFRWTPTVFISIADVPEVLGRRLGYELDKPPICLCSTLLTPVSANKISMWTLWQMWRPQCAAELARFIHRLDPRQSSPRSEHQHEQIICQYYVDNLWIIQLSIKCKYLVFPWLLYKHLALFYFFIYF